MTLPGLLLLLILTVQCGGGCDEFLREVVESLKTTINNNHAEFRRVFPVDYKIKHHYNDSLFCTDKPCCVFQAAAVLSDSWNLLLTKLWKDNHKYGVVYELKRALNNIKDGRLQDEPEVSDLPQLSSSPEELLRDTSVLFSRWLEMKLDCWSGECISPTEAPPPEPTPPEATPPQATPPEATPPEVEPEEQQPQNVRLQASQVFRHVTDIPPFMPHTNGCPSYRPLPGSLGTLLLCGLVAIAVCISSCT